MEKVFYKLPNILQNLLIAVFNISKYQKRYGGNYKKYLKQINKNNHIPLNKLTKKQNDRFLKFIMFSNKNSTFYNNLYKNIDLKAIKTIEDIQKLPIVNKESLRTSIQKVYTINKTEALIAKTGGTTGKSLEVYFTKDDIQMRYAYLDNFRFSHGYKLGKKTAWFSGKSLLNNNDLKKNRFWKTDYYYNVRYYSTFHIDDKYLGYYLKNLIKFKPKYMVGFPSTILEIAKYGIRNNINFPKGIVNTIFPTAETITHEIRNTLSNYFHTNLVDQYASSEGAPFIFECKNNNLHLELQSGIFEVIDNNDNPTNEGRLIVTAFNTHGTPLIRYDIGDNIKLAENKLCTCGNNNPLVAKIMGRIDDYIYSSETGKINLGNVSNTLKNVHGIKKFQVIQTKIDKIEIKIIIDNKEFSLKDKEYFLNNWRDRVGHKMKIILTLVNEIPVEKSGKSRMIKNNIKNLLPN